MKRIDIIGMNGNDGLHYKKVTTMDIQQLQRFIDAFKTGNFSNFHGDTQEFTVELAEEVMRLNENLMGLPNNPKIDEVFDFWEEHHSEDDDDVSPLDTQVGGDHYKDQKIQPVEYIHRLTKLVTSKVT